MSELHAMPCSVTPIGSGTALKPMPRQGSSVLVPQDSVMAFEVGGSSQPVLGWQSAHSTLASLAQRSSHWVLQQNGST